MSIEKPNILIIMADQMTASLMGAYGHKIVKTPNLDKLCEEGIRFDNAYTPCPLCAPARASMMAGKLISKLGTYDNGTLFPGNIPTFAHMLRSNDYEVVCSGKMHYVGPDQLHGIERRLTTDIYPSSFGWVPDWQRDREDGIQNAQGKIAENTGVANWTRQLNYDEEVQAKALEFLRTRIVDTFNRKDELRPFCLFTSFTHPHSPFRITEDYFNQYANCEVEIPVTKEEAKDSEIEMDQWIRDYAGISDDILKDSKKMATMRRAYYGMITYVDDKVGELLDTLDKFNLRKNTAIFFTSDHGEMLGERGLIEKRIFYENSARIPLIASFPKEWQQGKIDTSPVSLVDFFPTLAEFCGESIPENLDGTSFLSNLKEAQSVDQDRVVFSEYHGEGVLKPCFMARDKRYKYIKIHDGGEQLFDLQEDPNELKNLIDDDSCKEMYNKFKKLISEKFDSKAIEKDVIEKQQFSKYIHSALSHGENNQWDHCPVYPGKTMYER